MIKRFCDRCETELSKGDYVHLSMNGYGLNKHNNKYNSKDAHLSHLGIAIKNKVGEMVSYDANEDEIVNVDLIDIDA